MPTLLYLNVTKTVKPLCVSVQTYMIQNTYRQHWFCRACLSLTASTLGSRVWITCDLLMIFFTLLFCKRLASVLPYQCLYAVHTSNYIPSNDMTNPLQNKKSGNTFLSKAPRIPWQQVFLEGSQVSPVCPTGKRRTWKKRSMEHSWNDTGREITKALGEDHVPVPLSPIKTSHGPAWD